MSGGHFNYDQYRIGGIASDIEEIIAQEENRHDHEYTHGLSDKTLGEFRNAVMFLKLAEIYAQRVDWLVCGDDGEETFHKRLKADLEKAGLFKA